jgi:hypothetical protein
MEVGTARANEFPNVRHGSPRPALKWLYRVAWSLEKVDPKTLSLPADSDYRDLDHLFGELDNAAADLISTMETESQQWVVMDFGAGSEIVRDEVTRGRGVVKTIDRIIHRLADSQPAEAWRDFENIPYAEEVVARRSFLNERFGGTSPTPDGFWFGIGTPIRDGLATFDAEVFGRTGYSPEDREWDLWPSTAERNDLHSEVLGKLYDLGHRTGSLATGSELIALAYALALGREMVREFKSSQGLDRVGLAAGFLGGGTIHLGWI